MQDAVAHRGTTAVAVATGKDDGTGAGLDQSTRATERSVQSRNDTRVGTHVGASTGQQQDAIVIAVFQTIAIADKLQTSDAEVTIDLNCTTGASKYRR